MLQLYIYYLHVQMTKIEYKLHDGDRLLKIFLGGSSSMVVQKIRKTGNSGLKKQGK